MSERVALPLLLVTLASPLLFYGLGSYSLVNGDEGIYHAMARNMVESGDWFRLEFTGEPRIYDTFTHAPLFLWGKAVVILVLGDSWLSMRILTAVIGLLSLLATVRLVDTVTGEPRAAFLAGLVQLTTYQYVYLHSARTGEMETSITLAFTLAAYFFLRAVRGDRSFVAHHLCLVALLNLKLALVAIPLLAEAAFFAVHRGARPRWREWACTALWVLPLGLAWHGYQLFVHWEVVGEVFDELLGQSGAQAFRYDVGLSGRIGYYTRHGVFGTAPWTALYLVAVLSVLSGVGPGREREAWSLLGWYVAAVFGFFLAVAIHHPWYTQPAIPFLSAFTGAALTMWAGRRPARTLVLAIAAALAGALLIEIPITDFNPFAERAARSSPDLGFRGVANLSPWIGAALLTAVLAGALELLSRFASLRVLAISILAVPLTLASVRIVAPLRYVEHTSEMARLRSQLDADLESGNPIDYPVIVTEGGWLKARFYFGDDFRIRRLPRWRRRTGEFYRLDPPVE